MAIWELVTLAYVGPGAGLSMLGALAAVACVLLLAALSPVLFVVQLCRNWLRGRRQTPAGRA